MKWIKPDSPDFDQARKVFNAMIDRRPAVIAQCSNDAEVAEALRYGRENSLAIAVRAGGHSVAGMSTNDGGLVVDVRPMKSIDVDPESGIVTVGAGVTGEPDHAAQEMHTGGDRRARLDHRRRGFHPRRWIRAAGTRVRVRL